MRERVPSAEAEPAEPSGVPFAAAPRLPAGV